MMHEVISLKREAAGTAQERSISYEYEATFSRVTKAVAALLSTLTGLPLGVLLVVTAPRHSWSARRSTG
jgi:ABC-type methionine transport system permease subunit